MSQLLVYTVKLVNVKPRSKNKRYENVYHFKCYCALKVRMSAYYKLIKYCFLSLCQVVDMQWIEGGAEMFVIVYAMSVHGNGPSEP